MKNLKKLTGIILALLMMFMSVGGAFAAFATQADTAAQVEIQAAEAEITDGSIADVFTELFEKIKKIVLTLIGNIRTLFDTEYSKVDVSEYSEDAFEIPALDKGFVPQGICYVEALDAFAISGYIKGENSRLYFVDNKDGDVKELILKDFTKHTGGIASDGANIWVAAGGDDKAGGYIYHLSVASVLLAKDGDEIEFDGSFQTQVRASTLCCDGEMLYVAEFYEKRDYPVNPDHAEGDNKAWAVGYELPVMPYEYDGEEKAPDVIISIPEKVQGMAISAEGNILFSSSYGRFNDSSLYVYEPFESWTEQSKDYNGKTVSFYIADENSFVTKIKMPTLMEGIDVEGNGLYVLFESGAEAYSDAKEIIKNVRLVDVASLILNA